MEAKEDEEASLSCMINLHIATFFANYWQWRGEISIDTGGNERVLDPIFLARLDKTTRTITAAAAISLNNQESWWRVNDEPHPLALRKAGPVFVVEWLVLPIHRVHYGRTVPAKSRFVKAKMASSLSSVRVATPLERNARTFRRTFVNRLAVAACSSWPVVIVIVLIRPIASSTVGRILNHARGQ
jgi:hypothetical protein